MLELAVSANRDVYSAPPRREQSPHDGDVDSGTAYSEASGASRGTAAGQRHAKRALDSSKLHHKRSSFSFYSNSFSSFFKIFTQQYFLECNNNNSVPN